MFDFMGFFSHSYNSGSSSTINVPFEWQMLNDGNARIGKWKSSYYDQTIEKPIGNDYK